MLHDDDVVTNTSSNPHINELIEQRLQDPARRKLLRGGFGAASLSFIGASGLLAGCGGSDDIVSTLVPAPAPAPAPTPTPTPTPAPTPPAPARPTALSFSAVSKSVADALAVPAGYTASVLYRLGDPIAAGVPAYANNGTDAAATYDRRAGDHHDAIQYYGLGANGQYSATSNDRGLLVMNHEAITPAFLHPAGQTIVAGARTVADEVLREFYIHGVSVVEVIRAAGGGAWTYKQDSTFNRRVHTLTEMIISGPAGGTSYMVTKYSTNGTRTRGTVNDCAHGYTPWNTYLACEENWAGYFRRVTATDNPNRSAKELASLARYGVAGNGRELWATVTPDTTDNLYGRWNAEVKGSDGGRRLSQRPEHLRLERRDRSVQSHLDTEEAHRDGPLRARGAWVARPAAGKPIVFYMGCDSRNEYIYKYVSTALWDPADATLGLAAGDKYLDAGKLYAAKFNADGTGQWLELTFGVGECRRLPMRPTRLPTRPTS